MNYMQHTRLARYYNEERRCLLRKEANSARFYFFDTAKSSLGGARTGGRTHRLFSRQVTYANRGRWKPGRHCKYARSTEGSAGVCVHAKINKYSPHGRVAAPIATYRRRGGCSEPIRRLVASFGALWIAVQPDFCVISP
ncbi:hypothetical protein Bbelb_062650 [Branchiostoma belcheri]|nr:hypothetical protein Bbelb_062650 [Branchiostoma belcheri]